MELESEFMNDAASSKIEWGCKGRPSPGDDEQSPCDPPTGDGDSPLGGDETKGDYPADPGNGG